MPAKHQDTLHRFNRKRGGSTGTLVVGWLLGVSANFLVLSSLQDLFGSPPGSRLRPMHVAMAMAAAGPLGLIGSVCAIQAWWRSFWFRILSLLGFAVGLLPVPLGIVSLRLLARWKGLVYLP
jgi:hypothetical protein